MYIQVFSEVNCVPAIQNFIKRIIPDIADGVMKKTRAYRAVCLNYGGYPWRITFFIGERIQPIESSVVIINLTEFSQVTPL